MSLTEGELMAAKANPGGSPALTEAQLFAGYGVDIDAANVIVPGSVYRSFRELRGVRPADAARLMGVSAARISNAESTQATAAWAERYMNAIEGHAAVRDNRPARRVRALIHVLFVDDDGKEIR